MQHRRQNQLASVGRNDAATIVSRNSRLLGVSQNAIYRLW